MQPSKTILAPFLQSALRFVIPQIGVGDNETRFGRRNGHLLFLVKQRVEVVVPGVHAGRGNLLDLLIG